MRLRPLLPIVCLSLACGPVRQSTPSVDLAAGELAQSIIGGTPAGSDDSEVFGMMLHMGNSGGICTATLIGARTLLTAAHCVEADSIYATNTADIWSTPQSSFIKAKEWRQHPSYNPNNTGAGYDIALVLLEKAPGGKQKQWNMANISSLVGKSARLVGYGVRDDRQTDGEKYEVTVGISDVDNLLVTFDQTKNKGACFGDSGGPALYTFPDGVERIIGVTSFGEGQCQYHGYYTRVDTYASFISQWLSEKETPTCARDGLCKQGCTTPDIDCVCPADGTCNDSCPDPADDPDCDPACAGDDVCATGSCATPDPDCKEAGEQCETKDQCPGRECRTDDQHDYYYCSAKCDAGQKCPSGLECRNKLCLYPELDEAELGDKCTKGETYCGSGNVCAAARCQVECASDDDCGKNQACSGKDGKVRFCADKPVAPTGPTGVGPANVDPNGVTAGVAPGCAQADGSTAWIALVVIAAALRRRARKQR